MGGALHGVYTAYMRWTRTEMLRRGSQWLKERRDERKIVSRDTWQCHDA
jgi:hypothetical protein